LFVIRPGEAAGPYETGVGRDRRARLLAAGKTTMEDYPGISSAAIRVARCINAAAFGRRCIFCWVQPSREYPHRYGSFYGPEEVVERLEEESCDPYDTTLLRLGEAGWPLDGR
jgi:hypothetical protein